MREQVPQHFTASAVVICKSHILLVNHPRIGAWVPPGGHIEDFELPHDAGVREVLEETGVSVRILSPQIAQTESFDAFFLPLPLAIHNVKAFERGQWVHHIDLAYLCVPEVVPEVGLPELTHGEDVKDSSWVHLERLHEIPLAANVLELVDSASSRIAELLKQDGEAAASR